jgi:hypothetical protein
VGASAGGVTVRAGARGRMNAAGAPAVGDVLAVAGSGSAGASRTRLGEVVALAAHDVYRVRWTDGRETMLAASVAVGAGRGGDPPPGT